MNSRYVIVNSSNTLWTEKMFTYRSDAFLYILSSIEKAQYDIKADTLQWIQEGKIRVVKSDLIIEDQK